jgi:hypothetical protein
MRTRALAVATALSIALTPAAAFTAVATAKTKPPAHPTKAHAGERCAMAKKAPKGFVCKKDSKGKYVLVATKAHHAKKHATEKSTKKTASRRK